MSARTTLTSADVDSASDVASEDIEEANISTNIDGQISTNEDGENVKVMVRCRPAAAAAASANGRTAQVVQVLERERCVCVHERSFFYDAVFGPESDNERVYMRSARPLVDAAFNGYNCTVFLYGQTGTGKTHTHSALTSHAFSHLFSLIRDSNTHARFLIRASYYELYNEEIRDLLSMRTKASSSPGKPLELRESRAKGVYVKDLSYHLVNNQRELERLKSLGDKQRATAATRLNERSSRSHSIFSLLIEAVQSEPPEATAGKRAQDAPVRVGRLNLIDLAGSERQLSGSTVPSSRAGAKRLKEASNINLSLTCLSLVIRALTDKEANHVPYRNSKLTRLLSSSLGGNSKTLLVACVAPEQQHMQETLNTLRFASRTKRIKNRAIINEDAKDALLRKYTRQLELLKRKLQERQQQQESLDSATTTLHNVAVTNESGGGDGGSGVSEDQLQMLRLLRAKIMVGGENLLDKAEMHERLLEASRQELEEKRQEALRLKELNDAKKANIDKMQAQKGSLESQLQEMDSKLERARELHDKSADELRDLHCEHQELKTSLLQDIRATSRDIKYADCILEDFIPRHHWDLINRFARFDEHSGEWQIKFIAMSGNNLAQANRMAHEQDASRANRKSNINQLARPDPFIRLKG